MGRHGETWGDRGRFCVSQEFNNSHDSPLRNRRSGERGKRFPSGEIAVGDSAPNESIEASSGLKHQRSPLRRLGLRKDSAPRRNLNRRDCPLGSSLVSVEKGFDEISATGGHRILSPRPFGPEPKALPLFPVLSASFLNLSGISRFFRFLPLFPCFSACFQTGLNRTFGHFLRL